MERCENSLVSCFLEFMLPVYKLLILPTTTQKRPFYFLGWNQGNVLDVVVSGLPSTSCSWSGCRGSLRALAELL